MTNDNELLKSLNLPNKIKNELRVELNKKMVDDDVKKDWVKVFQSRLKESLFI